MIDQDRVERTSAAVKTIPEAAPTPPRWVPWLIVALAITTVGSLALAGWVVFDPFGEDEARGLADDAAVAWDTAGPTRLRAVYDPRAVVVDTDGSKIVGIDAIVAATRDRGATFTLTKVGDVATTSDGIWAAVPYRYAGNGRGSGISVIRISDGKIVRQWNFESSSIRPADPPAN
jgi:hypothetical protein